MNPERVLRLFDQESLLILYLIFLKPVIIFSLCSSVKVRGNSNLGLLCVVNEILEDKAKQLKKLSMNVLT